MTQQRNLVFVYGTLKQGQCRGHVMRQSNFIGHAKTITGKHAILNLGNFPTIVHSKDIPEAPESTVIGEIWEIDEKTLQALDRIEGYPFLYTREPISFELVEQVGTPSSPETEKALADKQAISYFYKRLPEEWGKRLSMENFIEDGNWDDSLAG